MNKINFIHQLQYTLSIFIPMTYLKNSFKRTTSKNKNSTYAPQRISASFPKFSFVKTEKGGKSVTGTSTTPAHNIVAANNDIFQFVFRWATGHAHLADARALMAAVGTPARFRMQVLAG